MREQVPQALLEGVFVENGGRGVPAFPEPSPPGGTAQPAELLREVAEEVLHEARELLALGVHDEMQVVGEEDVAVKPDSGCCRGPRENATTHFAHLGTPGGHQGSRLKGAAGDEPAVVRFEHAQWMWHALPLSSGGASSMARKQETCVARVLFAAGRAWTLRWYLRG